MYCTHIKKELQFYTEFTYGFYCVNFFKSYFLKIKHVQTQQFSIDSNFIQSSLILIVHIVLSEINNDL